MTRRHRRVMVLDNDPPAPEPSPDPPTPEDRYRAAWQALTEGSTRLAQSDMRLANYYPVKGKREKDLM